MRRLCLALTAGLMALTVVATSPQPAEARSRGGGFLLGAVAGALIGAVIVNEINRRRYKRNYYYNTRYYQPVPAYSYGYTGYRRYYY